MLLIRSSVGPAVKELQENLTTLGYTINDKEGVYSESTEEAVRAFQEANGLDADGKYGADTEAKLTEALEAESDSTEESDTEEKSTEDESTDESSSDAEGSS